MFILNSLELVANKKIVSTNEIVRNLMINTSISNKKEYVRGLSMQTFFSFAHNLHAIVDAIKYLLDIDKIKYVLPGLLNNDKIKNLFRITRALVRSNSYLDVGSFFMHSNYYYYAIYKLCILMEIEALTVISLKLFFRG